MSKNKDKNSIEKYKKKDINKRERQDIEDVKTVAKYSCSSTASYVVMCQFFRFSTCSFLDI